MDESGRLVIRSEIQVSTMIIYNILAVLENNITIDNCDIFIQIATKAQNKRLKQNDYWGKKKEIKLWKMNKRIPKNTKWKKRITKSLWANQKQQLKGMWLNNTRK